MGLVALWHVGSSWPKDLTCASCIGRRILDCWATREALEGEFLTRGSQGKSPCEPISESIYWVNTFLLCGLIILPTPPPHISKKHSLFVFHNSSPMAASPSIWGFQEHPYFQILKLFRPGRTSWNVLSFSLLVRGWKAPNMTKVRRRERTCIPMWCGSGCTAGTLLYPAKKSPLRGGSKKRDGPGYRLGADDLPGTRTQEGEEKPPVSQALT